MSVCVCVCVGEKEAEQKRREFANKEMKHNNAVELLSIIMMMK